ncbi:MAG: hypothetical protein PHW95_02480 [Patescibacteria group bacterium]|nr:hypothetical protein [Patescibacteria group bacterium]
MTLQGMRRMLRDFPWLWALGSYWDCKKVEMTVFSHWEDVHLLFHKAVFELTRGVKVFIQVTTSDSVERLIPVKDDEPPRWPECEARNYQRAILDAAPQDSQINYLVIVRTSRYKGIRNFEIWRPPSGYHCFRKYAEKNPY